MDIGQLQNSILSLGLAPVEPLFDPLEVPEPPIADAPEVIPLPDLPSGDLPEPEPPVLPDQPAAPAPLPIPHGSRSSRELPSLGGIPVGQLKALMQASQNAQLLAAAMGTTSAPPLQLSVSIQNVYLGGEQIASGTTLDITA